MRLAPIRSVPRPRFRALLLSLLLMPGGLAGQDCGYDDCALRVSRGIFSTKLVRGVTAEPVAKIGFRAPSLEELLGSSDSVAVNIRRFQRLHNRGSILTALGGAVSTASWLVATFADGDHEGLLIGTWLVATSLGITGQWSHKLGQDSLARAVWWYNRELSPATGSF